MAKIRKPKLISLKDDRVTGCQSKRAAEDKMKVYRLKKKQKKSVKKKENPLGQPIQHQQQLSSTAMYFHYNQHLGPPFHVIVDTNFINFRLVE